MQHSQPHHRWIRFRIRTLMFLVALAAVFFGWVAWNLQERQKEQAAISWIQNMGGQVVFHSKTKPDEKGWWEKCEDSWFGERVRLAGLQNVKECDFSQLSEFKNIEDLALSNSVISDLSPLEGLVNLDELYLEYTNVQDLTPLANLHNLEMLHLDGTPVDDLKPLANLKNLKWLKLRNTLLSEEDVQSLRIELPGCDIVYSPISKMNE